MWHTSAPGFSGPPSGLRREPGVPGSQTCGRWPLEAVLLEAYCLVFEAKARILPWVDELLHLGSHRMMIPLSIPNKWFPPGRPMLEFSKASSRLFGATLSSGTQKVWTGNPPGRKITVVDQVWKIGQLEFRGPFLGEFS